MASKRAEREQTILKLRTPLDHELKRAGIEWFEVTGRPKHLWSIFQKMRKRNKGFDEIYDLMAIRVIVRSVPECYHVLGIIHHNWTPIQERIKDYIASPKSNAYQSLHTTIFGPGGQLFEVQIRTQEMHRTAEFGIAAHWLYKRDGKPDELDQHLGWFRQLLELQQDTHSPEEFLEFLKVDLYQDEIFIFTPQGDVKRLPKGSTAIDFAFHVHTEVGLKCQGAKINGRIAPLHRELKSGDTVEILTGSGAQAEPRLAEPRAHRPRTAQDQAVGQPRRGDRQPHAGQGNPRARGQAAATRSPDDARLTRAAATLSLADGRGLEIAVGRGDVPIGQVMRALYPDLPTEDIQEPKPTVFGRVIDRIRLGRGIKIQGVDGLMVRYAQCCQPVPGDPVVGYVTQGQGHLDPSGRLSQSSHARQRRAAGRHRLAGNGGRGLRRSAGGDRRRPAGPLRRYHGGGQPDGHQYPRRRPAHQGRHRVRHHLRRGGQPSPPGQGDEGGSEGEGCDGNRDGGTSRADGRVRVTLVTVESVPRK